MMAVAEQGLRETAFQRFLELGFPTTHDEEWRFTNVARLGDRLHFSPLAKNGCPSPNLPPEAQQYLAKYAPFQNHAFVALNTAFFQDVAYIHIPRGQIVGEPIQIAHVGAGHARPSETALATTHPRTLIVVGPDAHCTIVETYSGAGAYFTNAVTEIVAGSGSVVDHYKVQLESSSAFHVGVMFASLGRSANFSATCISLGGALVRNEVSVTLSEGTDATLNGLYLVNGSQHVDNHTSIDHAQPHGTSHELYKGILDGKASAVFNGRIIVRKDAQKTDSKQTNKNLVLSDEAVIDTKPELQIFADDVRCTHGATIGQLDAESMFYLQSRGIGKRDARSLLTYAFAQDIIDRIKVQSLKDSLERILFEKFHEHDR